MSELKHAYIPEGCNFIGWFDSARSSEELAQMFKSEGWQPQAIASGYILSRVIQIPGGRFGRAHSYQDTLTLVTPTSGQPNVLSGQIENPDWMGREIRELLSRGESQSNTLICLWRDDTGGVWREIPATAELLGMNPGSLSDADQAAIATGYICQQVTGPTQEKQSPFVLEGAQFTAESVVIDDKGITHYDMFRGVFKLEWHQVREVAAEWIVQAYAPIPYATITGDTVELIVRKGCEGFPTLLARLSALPGFPSEEFSKALNDTLYDEKVVVWRRNVPE